MDLLLWIFAFLGHIGLWCVMFNSIHATALPRTFRKRTEKVIILAVALPCVFFLVVMLQKRTWGFEEICSIPFVKLFVYPCILFGFLFFVQWIYRKLTWRLPLAVVEQKAELLNIRREFDKDLLRPGMIRLIGNLPFNDCLKLSCERITFQIDVPQQLDGLKICQISDLHYTGQIGIEYFHRVVEEANQFEPDLIFITGDIVDKPDCLSWLDSTLGKLKSKHGVFYVLGNHDLRLKDEAGFREQLAGLGIKQAAGMWHQMTINGATVLLTGNELPWFRAADNLDGFPEQMSDLRILLSHSPDQLDWARSFGKDAAYHPKNEPGLENKQVLFDLMFAGHNHGGQVVFPIVGPIVAPSKYGVQYAAGTFEIENMLMHVSRGIGGDEPIRLLCPPELGLFTIKSRQEE